MEMLGNHAASIGFTMPLNSIAFENLLRPAKSEIALTPAEANVDQRVTVDVPEYVREYRR